LLRRDSKEREYLWDLVVVVELAGMLSNPDDALLTVLDLDT